MSISIDVLCFMHVFLKILLYINFFCVGDRHLHKRQIRFVLRSMYLKDQRDAVLSSLYLLYC